MVWRWLLLGCERAVNLVTALALVLCGCFGAYGLWDNRQVLDSAGDVRAELLQWKPAPEGEAEAADNGARFAALREINPELRGWLTMAGTGIDYPVLQGKTNQSYISRDVFGNFSLSGSIFLDSRDPGDLSGSYSLLYGHHMADGNMFGDLDKYRESAFFQENEGGVLILPDGSWQLKVMAVLVVGASEKWIFDPDHVRAHPEGWREFVRDNARLLKEGELSGEKFLALTTCASDFTDARTVVLARMEGVIQ